MSQSQRWRKKIVAYFLIFLIGGIVQSVLLDLEELTSLREFITKVCLHGSFWFFMSLGSELIVCMVDSFGIYWLEQPVKKLIIILSLSVTYIYLIVLLILFTYIDLVLRKEFPMAYFNPFRNGTFWITLGITLGISAFVHGKSFLKEWKAAVIKIEQLKLENLSARYDALKNQVNPHFLFNSLNSLSALVYEDQRKAIEFIQKLSQVYRYVLDKRDCELVSLDDELTFLNNYLFLQKIRFGDNLHIEIQKDLEAGWIPPLAIQMLVENAIKHNVICEEKPLAIRINVQAEQVQVSNNIQEKLEKDSTGIGLTNLKARYEYLSDQKVLVENKDNRFLVSIPLLKIPTPAST